MELFVEGGAEVVELIYDFADVVFEVEYVHGGFRVETYLRVEDQTGRHFFRLDLFHLQFVESIPFVEDVQFGFPVLQNRLLEVGVTNFGPSLEVFEVTYGESREDLA